MEILVQKRSMNTKFSKMTNADLANWMQTLKCILQCTGESKCNYYILAPIPVKYMPLAP